LYAVDSLRKSYVIRSNEAVVTQSNGTELRVEYTQSNTTILTSIINIMRVLTTTCFGLTCGPSLGCKIRLV